MIIPEWKKEVTAEYQRHNGELPGGMYKYLTGISEKHGVPYGTVRSHYYRLVKDLPTKANEPDTTPRVRANIQNDTDWKALINNDLQLGNLPEVAKTYFKQLAVAFQVKEATISAYYYAKIKAIKLATAKEEAEAKARESEARESEVREAAAKEVMAGTTRKTALTSGTSINGIGKADPQPEPPKKLKMHPDYEYKKGSIIQVVVKRVETYGAFVETMDEYRTIGLIHISQVRDKFISDMNKWFKMGMVLNSQVVEYSEADARLNLSTKNLPLAEYSWRKLDPKTDPVVTPMIAAAAEIEPMKQGLKEKLAPIKDMILTEPPKPTLPTTTDKRTESNMEMEWKPAKVFVESMIGKLSEAAEIELKAIMQEQGVFAFTVALMGKRSNFTPDVGLLLAQEIRKDISAVSVGEIPVKEGL